MNSPASSRRAGTRAGVARLTRRNFLSGSLAGLTTAPLALASVTNPAQVMAATGGISATGETVLFAFDDHAIPWRDNVQLTPVRAEKHPANPVLRRGPPGAPDHGHAALYGSVLHIGGKFRMWYLAMFETEIKSGNAPGWWRPMCYAESTDGVAWTKPDLGLVEFNGSRKNNICLVESEAPSLAKVNDFLSVMHDPGERDPQKRFKCAFITHPPFADVRGGRSGIGPNESRWCSFICATSSDGLRWKVVGDHPMNAGGERFEVSGLYRFGNFYYATGQLISPWAWRMDGSDIGRVMLSYRSADFDHWSRAKAMSFARPGQLTATPLAGQQTHMGAGIWNRGNVLVGLYGQWQDGPKEKPKGSSHLWGTHIDLGLIVSNDGIHFREPVPDHKVIAHGAEGEWDSIALLQGHAFANVGDKTMIWYSHWDTGGKLTNMDIGLATLRRDGFGYLSSKFTSDPAQFITSVFEMKHRGMKLFLNVDGVSDSSPIRVELLDESDKPVRGFSGADAARVTEAGTRREIHWPKSRSAKLPGDRKFAAKVSFPAGSVTKVYALYIGG